MKRTPFEKLYSKLSKEDKKIYLTLLYEKTIIDPRYKILRYHMGERNIDLISEKQEELLKKYEYLTKKVVYLK